MSKDADQEDIQEFDIDKIQTTTRLVEAHQRGNFLIGKTETGVKFGQRLPANKMLSKNEEGEFVLIDINTGV